MAEPAANKPLWDDRRLAAPHEQADKAERVRRMFDAIAGRYSLVNRVFSAGRDAAWRRAAVSMTQPRADDRLLDIACGTGDFTRAFGECAPAPRFRAGCDFAHNMLLEAARGSAGDAACWCEADALRLPFGDASFTIASCAFGVRNFQDLDQGLREMRRVLAPGGRAVILEFSRPRNPLFRRLYEIYSGRIMPWAASRVSGDRSGAYRYLPRSVVSFPDSDQMQRRLIRAGFERVSLREMTLGVVTIYLAHCPRASHG